MTDEDFITEIDRGIAEWKVRWPTIDATPKWHPVRQLRDLIEQDVLNEALKASKPHPRSAT